MPLVERDCPYQIEAKTQACQKYSIGKVKLKPISAFMLGKLPCQTVKQRQIQRFDLPIRCVNNSAFQKRA